MSGSTHRWMLPPESWSDSFVLGQASCQSGPASSFSTLLWVGEPRGEPTSLVTESSPRACDGIASQGALDPASSRSKECHRLSSVTAMTRKGSQVQVLYGPLLTNIRRISILKPQVSLGVSF